MCKMNYQKIAINLLAVLTLAGCWNNSTDDLEQGAGNAESEQADDATQNGSDEVSLDLQQVLNAELADEDPVTISELEPDDDKLFLYGPQAQEPFQVDGSIGRYIMFYSLDGESLKVGFSEFNQDNEALVLGSSDFERHIEELTIEGVEFTETSISIQTGDFLFEASPVSENQVEDQDGNVYTVYETTIDELLEDYQVQD